MNIKMPDYVENIITRLETENYEAYIVGGCVRDSLILMMPEASPVRCGAGNCSPSDWDVCTSARPEQVIELFSDMKTVTAGIKHGTVTVITENGSVEITTFRSDGNYSDGRHPDSVTFISSLEEDLGRRDFTVNAMAYSPLRGFHDPFGGKDDLKAGVLRCVGSAKDRFSEDSLRIIRALRFMSVKGFEADETLRKAVFSEYTRLSDISWERINREFLKFMCGNRVAELLDEYREVFAYLIPELEATFDFDQKSPYHNRDVWHHILCGVADIPPVPELRVAMLLHDIAKPVVAVLDDNGRGRFVGHPEKGAQMAEVILKRMKFSNEMTAHIVKLVRYHDAKIKPQRTEVRKWLHVLGAQTFRELMYVRHADASGKYEKYLSEAEERNRVLEELMYKVLSEGDCIDTGGLDVDGNDIRNLGLCGADIGKALEWLLYQVMEDRTVNKRAALLDAVRKEFL